MIQRYDLGGKKTVSSLKSTVSATNIQSCSVGRRSQYVQELVLKRRRTRE